MFHYSFYLHSKFFNMWTLPSRPLIHYTNLIPLLFLFLCSWGFCLSSGTVMSTSWRLHTLIQTAACIKTLHFWTVFSASFFEFLFFNIIYWWTFIAFNLEDHQKWRSDFTGRAILCSIVVLTTLIFLKTEWKLSWICNLLLKIMQKIISHKRKH